MNSGRPVPGRNDPCPCGSSRRFKQCCGSLSASQGNDQVDGLVASGDAARVRGEPRVALDCYARALALDPRCVEAHNNLGNAHLQLGQPGLAARCYREALALAPERAAVHANLGNAERQLGRLDAALASTQSALALDPNLAEAHDNLGLVLTALGRHREAVESFGRAIGLDPARAGTWRNLGEVQLEMRRIDEAVTSYQRALSLDARDTIALVGLAAAQRLKGQHGEAQARCRAALDIDPQSPPALALLAELRADAGDFAEAEHLYGQALQRDPRQAFAYYGRALHRRLTREDSSWLRGAESLLAGELPIREAVALRYTLGKYHDDVGEYAAAFGHFRLANELSKRQRDTPYRPLEIERRTDEIIRCFDRSTMRALQANSDPSERPLFIVGMPRSGTTLVEQILSSHPMVFGAGELAFWERALQLFEASDPATRAPELIPRLASEYLRRIAALSGTAARVIDKRPMNFMAAGLIHAVFPAARIIHLRRHPLDTCLSIYRNFLPGIHAYANDLDDLMHFFRQYQRLRAHWRNALPAGICLEVPYEELIGDLPGWTRRIVEFAGLPWDARCLNFHRTERVVITLSKWQVRQQISSASAGHWRHYEQFLGPLLPLLDPVID